MTSTEGGTVSARSIRRARERQAEREERREQRVGAPSKLAAGAGAALGATVLFAPAAQADTFTVSNLNDDGAGSLRQAAIDANQNNADDVITFASGLSGTIELSSGDIELYDRGLQIQGPGASVITVDGNENDRIFTLYDQDDPDIAVTISGLTLTGGNTPAVGGALYSGDFEGFAPELTLDAMVITGNHADGAGGGVYANEGSLTITNSVFSGNESGDESGGAFFLYRTDGDQQTEAVIRDSVFSNNSAYVDGGAARINYAAGETLIERSTFSANSSRLDGGALFFSSDVGAPVTITGSTFSGNSATEPNSGDAGAIRIGSFPYTTTISNSTISGNVADRSGGAIRINSTDDPDQQLAIHNTTITGNTAGDIGGGIYRTRFESAPGLYGAADTALSSAIVANNSAPTGPELGQDEGINDPDANQAVIAGFSLVEDTADATIAESPAGSNILGLDPQLGPLANNGGPTQTHLPALTSPVLDAGIANGLATEQRGLARTSDLALVANATGSDATDIGSVEIQAADVEAPCQGAVARKLSGTESDDNLIGTDAPEAIFALGGNDTATGAGGNDCVNGDGGNDNARGGSGDDEVDGGAGNDTAAGEAGNDLVKGGAGKDKASGGAGKDKLKGQGGADRLKGGGKADRLNGAGGKDSLNGGGGKDRLKGGKGKDRLRGGGGKDRLNCGGGDNDKVFASPQDKVSANCERVVTRG